MFIKKDEFPFFTDRKGIKHEAIAVTAIAPLLNLNLNYEKLHVKYTNSFDRNNYLALFFGFWIKKISFMPRKELFFQVFQPDSHLLIQHQKVVK